MWSANDTYDLYDTIKRPLAKHDSNVRFLRTEERQVGLTRTILFAAWGEVVAFTRDKQTGDQCMPEMAAHPRVIAEPIGVVSRRGRQTGRPGSAPVRYTPHRHSAY